MKKKVTKRGKGVYYGGNILTDATNYVKKHKKKIAAAIASAAIASAIAGLTHYRKHNGPLVRFTREYADPNFTYN